MKTYKNPQNGTLHRRANVRHIMGLMKELVFEVTQEAGGGFVAEALGESITTEANTWEELRTNVREAVKAYYFDQVAPSQIRLHLVRDELLAAS
jgi:hypothetical protein